MPSLIQTEIGSTLEFSKPQFWHQTRIHIITLDSSSMQAKRFLVLCLDCRILFDAIWEWMSQSQSAPALNNADSLIQPRH